MPSPKRVQANGAQACHLRSCPRWTYQLVSFDYSMPLPSPKQGVSYTLLFTNRFSGHASMLAVTAAELTAQGTAKNLVDGHIKRWRCPETLLSDYGRQLCSKPSDAIYPPGQPGVGGYRSGAIFVPDNAQRRRKLSCLDADPERGKSLGPSGLGREPGETRRREGGKSDAKYQGRADERSDRRGNPEYEGLALRPNTASHWHRGTLRECPRNTNAADNSRKARAHREALAHGCYSWTKRV